MAILSRPCSGRAIRQPVFEPWTVGAGCAGAGSRPQGRQAHAVQTQGCRDRDAASTQRFLRRRLCRELRRRLWRGCRFQRTRAQAGDSAILPRRAAAEIPVGTDRGGLRAAADGWSGNCGGTVGAQLSAARRTFCGAAYAVHPDCREQPPDAAAVAERVRRGRGPQHLPYPAGRAACGAGESALGGACDRDAPAAQHGAGGDCGADPGGVRSPGVGDRAGGCERRSVRPAQSGPGSGLLLAQAGRGGVLVSRAERHLEWRSAFHAGCADEDLHGFCGRSGRQR